MEALLAEDEQGRLWRDLGWIKDRIDSKLKDEYETLMQGIEQLRLSRYSDPVIKTHLEALVKQIRDIGREIEQAETLIQKTMKSGKLSSVAAKS